MSMEEALSQYQAALRQGLKEQKEAVSRGDSPHPPILDELLEGVRVGATRQMGEAEIPVERFVGMKSAGRTTAFSPSFLPLLPEGTEFHTKWIHLCADHLSDVGIRDPLVCYEYLGDFYVQEGNKRLSVLKFNGSPRINTAFYRIMPEMSDEPRIQAYYEFLSFYEHAKMYDVQFTQPGDYARLTACMGFTPDQDWTEEDRRRFRSGFHYFRKIYTELGGDALDMPPEEALLVWLQVHPYSDLSTLRAPALKKSLQDMWENFVTTADPDPIVRTQAPPTETKASIFNLLKANHVHVAFVHQRTVENSAWTAAHDLGRQHLEEALGSAVTVHSYFGADTPEDADALLDLAVAERAEVIFTTTPQLIGPCLKASIRHPQARFLNCSVHMPYSTVHTYYCRIYEAKFITGAIAGAMSDNNTIGYIGSYPIFGVPASINAFALGARMTNPRAIVELKWSCLPGNPAQEFMERGIYVVSNRDTPVGQRGHMAYGTYEMDSTGMCKPLGSPVWLWGKFYENVIRSILSGTWSTRGICAVNDWWGLSSGVIDVELSNSLPSGVLSLAKILRQGLRDGTIDPFRSRIVTQDGRVINEGSRTLSADEILHMDWLCDNVVGSIPSYDEILPISQPTVRMLGIHRDQIPNIQEVGV